MGRRKGVSYLAMKVTRGLNHSHFVVVLHDFPAVVWRRLWHRSIPERRVGQKAGARRGGEERERESRKRRRKSASGSVLNVTLLYSLANVDDDVFSFNPLLYNMTPRCTIQYQDISKT